MKEKVSQDFAGQVQNEEMKDENTADTAASSGEVRSLRVTSSVARLKDSTPSNVSRPRTPAPSQPEGFTNSHPAPQGHVSTSADPLEFNTLLLDTTATVILSHTQLAMRLGF